MTASQLERIASQMREFGFPSARVEERLSQSGVFRVLGIEVRDLFFPAWELEDPNTLARLISGQLEAITAGREPDWNPARPRRVERIPQRVVEISPGRTKLAPKGG